MSRTVAGLAWALCLGASSAWAGNGLIIPEAETVWPQWRARIALQTARLSPLGSGALLGTGEHDVQTLRGGAIFGDYYFARPWGVSIRASGGLLRGSLDGLTMGGGNAGPRLGLVINSAGTVAAMPGAESTGVVPYLGLGFISPTWRSGIAITADVGWVAENPGAVGGFGRAVFGNQGVDGALREMRLSPVLQLGLRYSF